MKTVKKFFLENFPNKDISIINIDKIEAGFTNNIYKVTLSNGKNYKLRIANYNLYINRELEKIIEDKFYKDQQFYFASNGDYIKKWINGKILEKKDLSDIFWESIIKQIKLIQSSNISTINISSPIYILEDHQIPKDLEKEFLIYKKIIDAEINLNNLVVSHNDISTNNIIKSNKRFFIIDFEWGSLNHEYWDIANLIKDLGLTFNEVLSIEVLINNFNFNLLCKIIYATYFYTYYWTYKVESVPKIINYRKKIIIETKYWCNELILNKII